MIVDDAMFMRKLIRRNLEAKKDIAFDIIEASGQSLHWAFWKGRNLGSDEFSISNDGMTGMKVLEEIIPGSLEQKLSRNVLCRWN